MAGPYGEETGRQAILLSARVSIGQFEPVCATGDVRCKGAQEFDRITGEDVKKRSWRS